MIKTDRVIIVVIVDDGARREYLLETVHVWLVITLQLYRHHKPGMFSLVVGGVRCCWPGHHTVTVTAAPARLPSLLLNPQGRPVRGGRWRVETQSCQNTFMFLTAQTLMEVCTVCPELKLRIRRFEPAVVEI